LIDALESSSMLPVWGNSSFAMLGVFAARGEVARIDWRIFRVLIAVSVLSLTSGCETISGILADLFGDSPIATPEPKPQAPEFADRIVVRKSKRTLELLHDGAVFESFPIALGREPQGPKQEEGDGRTPEGIYRIDSRSLQTRYTRALHISYPDEQDRDGARAMKVDPGGAIFIHGLPSDYGPFDPPQWYRDWTEGCISVGNAAIVKIWDAVPDGTPIEILP
jgi:murein L,D-transpeptidase YafK